MKYGKKRGQQWVQKGSGISYRFEDHCIEILSKLNKIMSRASFRLTGNINIFWIFYFHNWKRINISSRIVSCHYVNTNLRIYCMQQFPFEKWSSIRWLFILKLVWRKTKSYCTLNPILICTSNHLPSWKGCFYATTVLHNISTCKPCLKKHICEKFFRSLFL